MTHTPWWTPRQNGSQDPDRPSHGPPGGIRGLKVRDGRQVELQSSETRASVTRLWRTSSLMRCHMHQNSLAWALYFQCIHMVFVQVHAVVFLPFFHRFTFLIFVLYRSFFKHSSGLSLCTYPLRYLPEHYFLSSYIFLFRYLSLYLPNVPSFCQSII